MPKESDSPAVAGGPVRNRREEPTTFLHLELTGKCQLRCTHCYADSSPAGSHGTMTTNAWRRVIEEASQLGVEEVQFIGGEPTLHPALPELMELSLDLGLRAEVYSNLVYVPERLWQSFRHPEARLATSYYSDDPAQTAAITRGSMRSVLRSRDNLLRAIASRVVIRVGIIEVTAGQRVEQARIQLIRWGVPGQRIRVDRLRAVGRGQSSSESRAEDELCGNCADGVAAVTASGQVMPCAMSRHLPSIGNAGSETLQEILRSSALEEARRRLREHFARGEVRPARPPGGPKAGPTPPPCGPKAGPNAPPCRPVSDPCTPRTGPGR